MARIARTLVVALALASGCVASHPAPTPSPLTVEAELSAATLADDCAGTAGVADRREPGFADCAEDGCGFCEQTGVSVAIDAGTDGDAPVPFEVVAIRIHALDGTLLDTLDPHAAQIFVDGEFAAWDEQIAPGASLEVRYDTSAPDWEAIGGGSAWETYGMSFRIEMDVRIDGVDRTLDLAPVSREPEIVT